MEAHANVAAVPTRALVEDTLAYYRDMLDGADPTALVAFASPPTASPLDPRQGVRAVESVVHPDRAMAQILLPRPLPSGRRGATCALVEFTPVGFTVADVVPCYASEPESGVPLSSEDDDALESAARDLDAMRGRTFDSLEALFDVVGGTGHRANLASVLGARLAALAASRS
ncbi:hypothetical protein H9P43_009493 [Blastocladiella emersonii ATCC 22665]|nr:hypothetical protein H9P43_009493 [Blastocladiella emersonii ATCC 22665]